MRILFYLPVITPWWFRTIIVPMMRSLRYDSRSTELHVMIAPLWRNTGLEAQHLAAAADVDGVNWYVIDEGDPDQFRLAGAEIPGLLDLVKQIDPELTVARSADFAISQQFPGVVRYIMEPGAPPFGYSYEYAIFEEQPFAPPLVPASATALADHCAERLRPAWELVERRLPTGSRTALRERLGVPSDRPVISVPLLYEHPENYFLEHAGFPEGAVLIERLLAELDDEVVLAVVDHPLNRMYPDPDHFLHVDRRAVDACFARNPGRMVDCTSPQGAGTLARCADAMIADISKSWMLAAFHTAPLVNVAPNPAADWLNAVPGLAALPQALASGNLTGPDIDAAWRWFGWHIATRIVAPGELTLDRLLRCVEQCPSEQDIADNIHMVETHQRLLLPPQAAAA